MHLMCREKYVNNIYIIFFLSRQEGNCFTGTKEAPHIEKRRKLLHNPLKNETEAAVQNVIKELSGIK